MIFAEVEVSGVCAHAVRKRLIPAGIVGAQVSFVFTDSKWDNLTKTVVFKGFGTKDVLLDGDTVRIPQEVVSRKDVRLLVGVYGTDAENAIAIPTLWADLGTVRNAADPSGDKATDPSLPIWATLQSEIDKLKENGASDEQISAAVEAYLQENPVGTGTVKMVNGIEPDENGNVQITIPDSGENEVTDSLNDRKKKNTFAMVSFMDDDCREEVFTKLWPVIQDKGIPYTLACAPYDIGRVTDEYRFLRLEDELLPMYKAGVKIACHHYKQENMDTFATEADYRADLQACKEAFVQMGINDVDTICYPQGVVVDDYLKTIKEFNRMGFTVNRGINQIPYESYHMKRCEVFPSHGLWGLEDAMEYVNRLEIEGGWLIFMTHAWYKTFDPVGLGDLIDHITGKGIPIVDIPTAIETNGNIIEVGRFRKPIEEMYEPFFVADASGAVWANSVNTVAKSQVKTEVLNVKYLTGTYMKPGGSLYSADNVDVKRCVTVDIPAAPGERYRITGSAVWGGAIYAVYNQDGGVEDIRTSANTENGECLIDHEITMPANTAYFRVSFNQTKYPDQFAVKKLTSIPGNINGDGNSGGNVDLGVTGATVGQTVQITAVDENGVPTAWEPTDFPSGGGEEWELIREIEISESGVTVLEISDISLKKMVISTKNVAGIVTADTNSINIYLNNNKFGSASALFRSRKSISSVHAEIIPRWTKVEVSAGDNYGTIAKYTLIGIDRGSVYSSITSVKLEITTADVTFGVGAKFYLYGVRA